MHNNRGFTLIELIIVIALLGMVSIFLSKIYIQGLVTVQTQQNITDGLSQGMLGIERMARDITSARSPADITTMTTSQFTFVNNLGTSISYTLSGSNLTRNGDILATGINSLNFGYFDINNTSVATATSLAYVTINMNVTRKNVNYVLNTAFFLRDFSD